MVVSEKLYEFADEVGFIDPELDIATYETKYYETYANLTHELESRADARQQQSFANNDITLERLADQQQTFLERLSHVDSGTRLATIKVPTFSGNYQDWPSFRDLYTSAIANKPSFMNVQRFHHLTSCLKDDALLLIKHLSITEDNYAVAWERLVNRYDRKQFIIKSYILNFLSLPGVHNSNAASLRKLTDGADEVIRGLDALSVVQRDPWLIQLLLNKTDEDTKLELAERCDGKKDHTFQEFLSFLSHRCDVLEQYQLLAHLGKLL